MPIIPTSVSPFVVPQLTWTVVMVPSVPVLAVNVTSGVESVPAPIVISPESFDTVGDPVRVSPLDKRIEKSADTLMTSLGCLTTWKLLIRSSAY